ncbi:FIST signal transduction protein [Roseofilum casamattae]|uniref:FIST N-terminal domain-containing protein n=1 Tax=Roseofilum casamattae BLCC-M143 TaxID=3022442 RepID=A0ABT7BX19_9CYAN|nr:FIST N-terminal domain-containing protein [Roseofilum casamattae]MDJ1183367.1 FIST N-terminal domain-containing protein [Roseofilum casamattae BLCC-M143]
MFKVVVGHSNDPDSESAIAEVLEQCQETLSGAVPQAGILLAAIDFEHQQLVDAIHRTYPQLELIGGTTDGEMSSILGFEQDSVTLMLFCCDRITITAGVACNISQDLEGAIAEAVATASRPHSEAIKLCITLPESLNSVSAVRIVDNLNQELGQNVPIFGGLTADQWRFEQSYQFFKDRVYTDAIPILLCSGPLQFSHGVASGWEPIGEPVTVTRVEGNIVYQIDEAPALDFYSHYLGDLPPSSEYPLMVFDSTRTYCYLRAPSPIYNREEGSVTFFGDIPEGAIVQITEATRNNVICASEASMKQAIAHYPGESPGAALFFSCSSRRQILGSHTSEEYSQIHNYLRETLPSCGFYTNGEIAPLEQQGMSYFHNETFITLLLGES